MKKALSLLALAAVIAAVAVPVSSQALVIRDKQPAHEPNGLIVRDSVQTALILRDTVESSDETTEPTGETTTEPTGETTTEPTGETIEPTTDDQGLVIRDGQGLIIRDGQSAEPTEETGDEETIEPTPDDEGLIIRDGQTEEPIEEEPTTDDQGLVIRDLASVNAVMIHDTVQTALVIRDPDPNGKKAKEDKERA